jgi:hypothetical protein
VLRSFGRRVTRSRLGGVTGLPGYGVAAGAVPRQSRELEEELRERPGPRRKPKLERNYARMRERVKAAFTTMGLSRHVRCLGPILKLLDGHVIAGLAASTDQGLGDLFVVRRQHGHSPASRVSITR